MRLVSKYKNYTRVKIFSKFIPDRISKFKRPKWKKVLRLKKLFFKKKLKRGKKKKRKVYIYNPLKKSLRIKKWHRLKSFYREGLNLKRRFDVLFDNQFSIKNYKKISLKLQKNFRVNSFLLKFLVKPLFRLDILLWKLKFFSSSYESSQYIKKGFVFINSSKLLNNQYILSYGDIVQLNGNFLDKRFYTLPKINSFFNFIEFDYYNKSFIVIKNFEDYFSDYCMLLFHKRLNLKKFLKYVKSK